MIVHIDPLQVTQLHISSFHKNKGSKSDLNNDRGIFLVVKLRSILDRMIYNDVYSDIDGNMSDSNIGGRKGRNIQEHLFVINGIINDIINNKHMAIYKYTMSVNVSTNYGMKRQQMICTMLV